MSRCFKLLKQVNKQCKECVGFGSFSIFFTFATSVKPNMKFQEKCVYVHCLVVIKQVLAIVRSMYTTYTTYIKRLYLVKTTSWQHRFFDLANLSPMWLGTYEYMKNTLQNFFFRFETGLPEWIFQIWSKIFKSDRVFVYMKKSLF